MGNLKNLMFKIIFQLLKLTIGDKNILNYEKFIKFCFLFILYF